MPKFCSECAAPLREGANFCAKCGARFTTIESEPAPPATAPVSTLATSAGLGWNWSAFLLNWIWLIGHGLWYLGVALFLLGFAIAYIPYNISIFGRLLLAVFSVNTGAWVLYIADAVYVYAVLLLFSLPLAIYGNRILKRRYGTSKVWDHEQIWIKSLWWGVPLLIAANIPVIMFINWLITRNRVEFH